MMALEPTRHHASVHVAAQAELQPQAPAPRRARRDDLAAHGVGDVDDMAETVGPPRAQEHEELGVRGAGLGLGEVEGDAKVGGGRGAGAATRGGGGGGQGMPEPRGLLEGGLETLDAAAGRVATEVYADDAAGVEPRGEGDGVGGGGGVVAAVDGEDEAGVHTWWCAGQCGVGGGVGGLALVVGDGVEDGGDVALPVEAGAGEGARGGAQLEVDDTVGGEGAEDGEGGVAEGGEVVD